MEYLRLPSHTKFPSLLPVTSLHAKHETSPKPGTIDEKMYQRQRMKGDMARGVQGGAAGGAGGGGRGPEGAQFSREELRELFVLKPGTDCETRDLLQATGAAFADGGPTCADPAICAAAGAGLVSFVHLESEQGGGA